MIPFPLAGAAVLLLLLVFVALLRAVATLGTKKAIAHRELLRAATPPHDQSRAGDFDEWGRTW